jgi:hypothetical protein
MIIGKKGAGKTTLLTKLAIQHRLRGWKVYSDVYIPFTYRIKTEDIGIKHIPPNSVLLIDEVGMVWDNRNFKNFNEKVRDWFKLQRHYKVKVYMFSQAFDIDKKLRDLTDAMYLIEMKLRIFSYGKKIIRRPTLREATSDGESKLVDDMRWDNILFFWCGSRIFTFIPKYAKYYDSFDAPELEQKEFEYNNPEKFEKMKKRIDNASKKRKKRKKVL